jgi:hypothetical protein
MTTLTDTQVVTASGGLVELGYSQITSAVNVTSTSTSSPTTVISAITVICDGSPILVEFYSQNFYFNGANAGDECNIGLWVDGAESQRYWARAVAPGTTDVQRSAHAAIRLTPSAGSHTFAVTAFSSNGTRYGIVNAGSGGAGASPAFLRVSKIVTATQWPAVTTGTIICTSSTRPASPFEGQTIYETDTKRSWTRVGSQWVPDDMVFTNEAARDAAITSPTEGMRAYLTASSVATASGANTAIPTGVTTIYNGSVWVCVTPVGAYTAAAGNVSPSAYTTLSGGGTNPSVTLVTGTSALVSFGSTQSINPSGSASFVSVAVSGATTLAASDDNSAVYDVSSTNYNIQVGTSYILTGLTAGTNTFTLNYRVTGGTGTFQRRRLVVQGVA